MHAQTPATFAEVLEQLDRPVANAGAQPPRRPGETLPDAVLGGALEEEDLTARALDRDPCRDHAGVVENDQRGADDVRKVCERPVINAFGHAIVDQQARLVAARQWPLRDEAGRKVVVELVDPHPNGTLPLSQMDDSAIERAKERIAQRADAAALDEVLERTRAELEALAKVASAAATGLPERVEWEAKAGIFSVSGDKTWQPVDKGTIWTPKKPYQLAGKGE